MLKRGKEDMVYHNQKQTETLYRWFEELSNGQEFVAVETMNEVLISLGLEHQNNSNKVSFQQFLHLLKEGTVRNSR